jgi:hypothetical protein
MNSPSLSGNEGILAAMLAMEERMNERFVRSEERINERMSQIEESVRAGSPPRNLSTPEVNVPDSIQEPLTPFLRSYRDTLQGGIGAARRQTLLQTDEDGVEYAVRDSAYKKYLPDCKVQFTLDKGGKISPSKFLDAYRDMRKYQEKYQAVLVDFRYAQQTTPQFRAEVCSNLRGDSERTSDEFFGVNNMTFLQCVQKSCSVKTIESYYDTLVNDLSRGENAPNGAYWSVSRMGKDFTWFSTHFKAFAELEEFMQGTDTLGFLPDVNAKPHGAAAAYRNVLAKLFNLKFADAMMGQFQVKLKLLAPVDGGVRRFKYKDFAQFQEIVKSVFKDLRDVSDLNAKYQPLYFSSVRDQNQDSIRFKRKDDRQSLSLLTREDELVQQGSQERELTFMTAAGDCKPPCLKLMINGQCGYGTKCTYDHGFDNNEKCCLPLMKSIGKYYNSGKQAHERVNVTIGDLKGNVPGNRGTGTDFTRSNRTFDKSVSMFQFEEENERGSPAFEGQIQEGGDLPIDDELSDDTE